MRLVSIKVNGAVIYPRPRMRVDELAIRLDELAAERFRKVRSDNNAFSNGTIDRIEYQMAWVEAEIERLS